jgi:hypothetical protein
MRPISEVQVDSDELRAPPARLPPPPFSDIPGSVWTAFLGAWALLFGLFLLFFSTDGPATMAVVTACFFAIMILGLPAALGTQTHVANRQPRARIVTHSGPIPLRAAATQILLIPVASVFGVICLIILAR